MGKILFIFSFTNLKILPQEQNIQQVNAIFIYFLEYLPNVKFKSLCFLMFCLIVKQQYTNWLSKITSGMLLPVPFLYIDC